MRQVFYQALVTLYINSVKYLRLSDSKLKIYISKIIQNISYLKLISQLSSECALVLGTLNAVREAVQEKLDLSVCDYICVGF